MICRSVISPKHAIDTSPRHNDTRSSFFFLFFSVSYSRGLSEPLPRLPESPRPIQHSRYVSLPSFRSPEKSRFWTYNTSTNHCSNKDAIPGPADLPFFGLSRARGRKIRKLKMQKIVYTTSTIEKTSMAYPRAGGFTYRRSTPYP